MKLRSYLDDVKEQLQRDEQVEDATERMISTKQELLRERQALQDTVAPSGRCYELTLTTRPLGFSIGESSDGYVVVTAIDAATAPKVVRYAVQVGDRLVAVAPALSPRQLWPVSTVAGATAAVTGRFPGTSVRVQFERAAADANTSRSGSSADAKDDDDAVVEAAASPAAPTTTTEATAAARVQYLATSAATTTTARAALLSRCRALLRRYQLDATTTTTTSASRRMAGLVADKVVDALQGGPVDAVTTSMLMTVYLDCQRANDAVRVFEAATGFAGDGSLAPVTSAELQWEPSEAALDIVTGTCVMRAQSLLGNGDSVLRVLAALEGRSEDPTVAPWPWTGAYGTIQPDTQCYNVAMAAAEKVGGARALLSALELFERMADPGTAVANNGKPVKDVVTYNTLISALTRARRGRAALALFNEMKRYGLQPNKITYTTLMRACARTSDVQELLYDMTERGIRPDTVTYNTMIRACCANGLLSQAMDLVNEMERNKCVPDSKTYGLLMNGLLKTGQAKAVLTLYESASADPRTTALMDNNYIGTTAITAASSLRKHETALHIVGRMQAKGVKPNVRTLTAVMGACLQSGRADLAAKVYETMDAPDGIAMRQGIRAMSRLDEGSHIENAAQLLISQPPRRKLNGKLTMLAYKDVLEGAVRNHKISVARDLLTDLLSRRFIPNKAMLQMVVDLWGLKHQYQRNKGASTITQDQFKFLLFCIDILERKNIPIESVLYTATLIAAQRLGTVSAKETALRLVESHHRQSESTEKEEATSHGAPSTPPPLTWETLFDQHVAGVGESQSNISPRLRVRVSPKDFSRMMRAEQDFSNHGS